MRIDSKNKKIIDKEIYVHDSTFYGFLYDNDEKTLSSDIGFDNLNNIVQNQSVIETLNYYKEVHYANEADSIKVSSTDMINEIKNRIWPSKTNDLLVDTTTSENYFYFELKNKR